MWESVKALKTNGDTLNGSMSYEHVVQYYSVVIKECITFMSVHTSWSLGSK